MDPLLEIKIYSDYMTISNPIPFKLLCTIAKMAKTMGLHHLSPIDEEDKKNNITFKFVKVKNGKGNLKG